MIDTENLEEKFEKITNSEQWQEVRDSFKKSSVVYIFGNGGLFNTASHASSDATRLLPNKFVLTLDNISYLTSVANDYGYETIFEDFVEKTKQSINVYPSHIMVFGLSCSGNSQNILNVLNYASKKGYNAHLLSGQPCAKNLLCRNVVMNTTYFHTSEILSMLLVYDLIDYCGGNCPTIKSELERKHGIKD